MGGDALQLGRSGVALATRQTLMVLHLRVQGLAEGDEYPHMLS